MKISSIETSFIDYPNRTAMVIFMSGCDIGCPNCHNPILQNPNIGAEISSEKIFAELQKRPLCSAIVFSGGDPLYQSDALISVCKDLHSRTKIGVYTGKTAKDVPEELLKYIDFLKTEPYIEKLGNLSSPTTNQKCWDVQGGVMTLNMGYFNPKD